MLGDLEAMLERNRIDHEDQEEHEVVFAIRLCNHHNFPDILHFVERVAIDNWGWGNCIICNRVTDAAYAGTVRENVFDIHINNLKKTLLMYSTKTTLSDDFLAIGNILVHHFDGDDAGTLRWKQRIHGMIHPFTSDEDAIIRRLGVDDE